MTTTDKKISAIAEALKLIIKKHIENYDIMLNASISEENKVKIKEDKEEFIKIFNKL